MELQTGAVWLVAMRRVASIGSDKVRLNESQRFCIID